MNTILPLPPLRVGQRLKAIEPSLSDAITIRYYYDPAITMQQYVWTLQETTGEKREFDMTLSMIFDFYTY